MLSAPPNYQNAITKVEKATKWQKNNDLHGDDFLWKIQGLCWIRHAENSSDSTLFDTALGCLERSLKLNRKNHDTIRLKGVALSGKGEFDAAIACYIESLSYQDDYLTYINWGNALAEKKCLDEAIQKFEFAIQLNCHIDYDAHNNLGIAYYRLNKYKKAIECFTFVLNNISSSNFEAHHNLGIVYYRLRKYRESIKHFLSVLDGTLPNNFDVLCLTGFSYHKSKDYRKAIEYYDMALKVCTDSKPVLYNKSLAITRLSEADPQNHGCSMELLDHFVEALTIDAENNAKLYCDFCRYASLNPDGILPRLGDQRAKVASEIEFYKNNENNFETKSQEYQDLIKSEKAKYTKLLIRSSRMPSNRSLLFFLRKWNSYTPAIPAYDRISVGGGYFIWHEKIGIVIDPGYNFLENFYRAGGSIADIDIIIITHSHDDHTIQLEQLVSLLIKYNDEKSDAERKKVHFFLSLGVFQKFAGIIDLSSDVFAHRFTVLNVNDTVRLTNKNGEDIGNFTALPTYHYEICSHDYGIGLLFRLFPVGQSTELKLILMTSDTGLVPFDKNEKNGAVPLTNYEDKDIIYNRYLDILNGQKVNLMLLHIGSIKEHATDAIP